MSKKNTKTKHIPRRQTPKRSPTAPPDAEPPLDLELVILQAEEDHKLSIAELDLLPPEKQLPRLIQLYVDSLKSIQDQEENISKKNKQLDIETRAHQELKEKESKETESIRSELDILRRELVQQRADLEQRRAEIAQRAEDLVQREADADAGFLARREQSLACLREAQAQLQARLDHDERVHIEQITANLHNLDEQRANLRATLDAGLATRLAELQAREEELGNLQREAQQQLRHAQYDLADAKAQREQLQLFIEQAREDERSNQQVAFQHAQERYDELLRRCNALEQANRQLLEDQRQLGHDDPAAVRRQLDAQRTQIERLEEQLRQRPTPGEAEELQRLREEERRWDEERERLRARQAELLNRVERNQLAISETELLRDRNSALENSANLLRKALEQVQADFAQALGQRAEQPVFAQLQLLDQDKTLSTDPGPLWNPSKDLNLKHFSADVRNQLATMNDERAALYYTERDLRAFIAGLAMSRLHLLQGISGIGKSSLPRAFAAALGGSCVTVPVQAGWRDRHDLFGHYNSFDRRFFESSFTQALYRAQTPQWRDRLCLILLDEMNLSHPEQYAADLLDVLERPDERDFELVPFQLHEAQRPRLLTQAGRLPLPENIWFIGTANHDETTRDFADKTYDRSFVLELPDAHTLFKPNVVDPRKPISMEVLQTAFKRATEVHESSAKNAMNWMDKHLKEPLANDFRIGWGARLQSQLSRFIPVFKSAGGSVAEAVDQALTTRVLRRLRGRHDNSPENLRTLHGVLERAWESLEGADTLKLEQTDAHRLLHAELRRQGEDL